MLTDSALIAILTASRSPATNQEKQCFFRPPVATQANVLGKSVRLCCGSLVSLSPGNYLFRRLGNHGLPWQSQGVTGTTFCLSILGMTAAYIIASEALGAISFGGSF